ncbi:MAG: glucose-1-phosphate adenylyltransferase [Eubacteriales bacterium]|nr:glucose-1-phosphate adenylyltransferase [Eubacteriales bacterium]
MRKKECVAMLLAGGQGSRLLALTKKNAKPAVAFGGKYRIIDFSLSNCVNSSIDTVGVLTQYKPTKLNAYLNNGEAWDLDTPNGGVHVLPPYATESGGNWYDGTADAIFQNIDFIDTYNPNYVIILSGDHLYKMDYTPMLKFHKEKNADLTVSVMEVPLEEAPRFGIMSINENFEIIKFQEKPKKPESNLASMGLYIFSWSVLRKSLIDDSVDEKSEHDFGKNIIPKLLNENKKLVAYKFHGYWQDVGTIQSYYDTQMALLEEHPVFDIFDRNMRIYSNANVSGPQYIGKKSKIEKSLICNGCIVNGTIKHSILSSDVVVEDGAIIEDSILLPNSYVCKKAHIKKAIIGENTLIKSGVTLCKDNDEIYLIGDNQEVG